MDSQSPTVFFLKKNFAKVFVFFGIIFVLVYSFSTLTTKPRIWTDEAVSIEIARNFQVDGVLDVKVAPGEFSGFSERIQSTGYPVTIPLAWFFSLFGYGIIQARIYMIIWLLLTAIFSFWLAKRWFGKAKGLAVFFLLISFASFYASGRTVVGEVPGFLFMLFGLYFLFERRRYFWSGLFLGFAVVSKLSVFGLLIPVLVVTYLFERRKFFRTFVPLSIGMLPAGVAWIFLNLGNPLAKSVWTTLFSFYANPYSSSIYSNIAHNFLAIPYSTTIIYFGVLFTVIAVARFIKGNEMRTLYNFVIIYGIFAFVYYLRSPGWLRYILIAELLILFLLPDAISLILSKLSEKYQTIFFQKNLALIVAIVILVIIQTFQMFYKSEIFTGDGALQASASVNKNFSGRSVGVLNAIEVAVLLDSPERFLAMDMVGVPQIGKNPLFYIPPPEVIVSYPKQRFLVEGAKIIEENYGFYDNVGGYNVYERK